MNNWMDDLVETKYKNIFNIVILTVGIIAIGLVIYMQKFNKKNKNEDLNLSFKGSVKEKYIDVLDHNQPIIIFKNDSLFGIYREWYDLIEVGDSVIKNKGLNSIIIIKNNDTVVINSPKK